MRKAAKVYEANEAVEGMKPKAVYESHKKCTPGEFGAHVKEALVKAADSDKDKDKAPASSARNDRKRRAKNRAEDLVPMKGFGRGFADYVMPSTFGGTRAGRATMIAKALGKNPDFSVSNPNTDTLLSSLGGGIAGGLGGAALGGLGGALTGNLDNAGFGAILGGGLGYGLGNIAGIAGSGMDRREHMQKIQDSLASELEQHGTSRLKLDAPQYSALSSILQPLSGAHRAGQADAYEALRDNTRYAKTPGRTAGYLAAHVPHAGPLINMGHGMAQNFSARDRMKQDRVPQMPIDDEFGLKEFGRAKAKAAAYEFGARVKEALVKAAASDDDEADDDKAPASSARNDRKRRAKNRAEDLVPMKGFGRGFADYVMPSTFGGTRAGRATMIAKALGKNPDFSVSHPRTDHILSSLGGGLVGGLGGAALGGLGGALTGNLDNVGFGAILGGGLGATGGSVLGGVGAGMDRREQMQKIQDSLAGELEQHGTSRLKLDAPQYSALSSVLQPFSGAHRAGQADAYEALRNNTRYAKTPGRTAGYLASQLGNVVGPAIRAGHGMAQNFSARDRMKQDRVPQMPIDDEFGLNEFGRAKAADISLGQSELIAPLLAASVGGVAGAALGDPKKKLKNALVGAGVGGIAGGLGEYTLPGLGLGAKYLGQDALSGLGSMVDNGPTLVDKMQRGSSRGLELLRYAMKRRSDLPGLQLMGQARDAMTKKSSAYGFGQKVALSVDWNAIKNPALGGAAVGALAGGVHGLLSPGEDEDGKKRNRFKAMLRGAAGGGAVGGIGGAAAGHFAPGPTNDLMNRLRYQYTMNTPVPTQAQARTRQNFNAAAEEPFEENGMVNPAMRAAQG